MGHYRRKFGLSLRIQEKPRIHANNPSGRGKSIELFAVDNNKRKAMVLQLAPRGEFVSDILEVVIE